MCIRDSKKTDAWNQFTQDGVTPPSLTVTSNEQNFLFAYRSYGQVTQYWAAWWRIICQNGSIPSSVYEDLDNIRVSIWRQKDESGKPWKGIDTPGSNDYKLRYQSWIFRTWAEAWLAENTKPPPTPPNEFSANEHKALKAFAGGLEATQEFVPDEWLSPEIQMEPQNTMSEEVSWRKEKTWRRSLDEVVHASRKALQTALRRQ